MVKSCGHLNGSGARIGVRQGGQDGVVAPNIKHSADVWMHAAADQYFSVVSGGFGEGLSVVADGSVMARLATSRISGRLPIRKRHAQCLKV
jgi:hypothetical protein